jgi:hypothetical protein
VPGPASAGAARPVMPNGSSVRAPTTPATMPDPQPSSRNGTRP